mgnify:CR=1 FL=1
MLIEDAVSPGTPQFVNDSYATLAERAKTQSFGLIEEDVIVLDTETTGLSVQDNELIEISAARLSGREIIDRFDTFVHPKQLIPAEITELTSITNADVADAPSAVEACAAAIEDPDFVTFMNNNGQAISYLDAQGYADYLKQAAVDVAAAMDAVGL